MRRRREIVRTFRFRLDHTLMASGVYLPAGWHAVGAERQGAFLYVYAVR